MTVCYPCAHKVNFHWEVVEAFYLWSGDDLMLYLIKGLLLPPENLKVFCIDFFFECCFFSPPLFLMFVLQTSVLAGCMQTYKWIPQLLVCVAGVILSGYIYRTLPVQRFGLAFQIKCTFPNKMLQVKQTLYLPGRTTHGLRLPQCHLVFVFKANVIHTAQY